MNQSTVSGFVKAVAQYLLGLASAASSCTWLRAAGSVGRRFEATRPEGLLPWLRHPTQSSKLLKIDQNCSKSRPLPLSLQTFPPFQVQMHPNAFSFACAFLGSLEHCGDSGHSRLWPRGLVSGVKGRHPTCRQRSELSRSNRERWPPPRPR